MSLVTYELRDHIATITLNRPEARNAINGALRLELNAAWERFRDEEDAWVGILTATGDVFCAGGDLKDGEGSVGTFAGTFWEKPTINSFESGMELFKPTIAAVHGACVGYGLTGVLFCDFVIASTAATFSYPEVSLGMPTIVGAIRLPERLRWADAMELLLTGQPITAERAHADRTRVAPRGARAVAGRGTRMGAHPHRGRAAGATGHQGGRMAHRQHGVDRVGPVR